ncbi:MAG TPA: FAD-dependent oxidoreductase [Chthoniobacterales bacterium]|nr:FAD-dependent oxidoreductase [Chthoniobacterales bacterium]
MVGAAGGAAAVYETMVAMGLLATPTAFAGPPNTSGAPGKGKSVLVLGAGVAGLVAAYRLRQAKYSVTVIEASNRIGGRNFTVSTATANHGNVIVENGSSQQCKFVGDPSKQYFEAGPGRIPYHHIALLELCRELTIALEPYIMETRTNRFQKNGAFDNAAVENRRIANDTRGYIASLLAKAVDKGALDEELTPFQLGDLGKTRLLNLLGTFGNIGSKPFDYTGSTRSGYIVDPGVTEAGTQPPKLDLAALLESEFWTHRFYQPEDYLWQPTLFQPKGGMRFIVSTIVNAFDRLPQTDPRSEIITGAPVTEIKNGNDGVVVTVGGKPRAAHYCFSTIPLPLLSGLPKTGFTEKFLQAVRVVQFAKTCKVGWQAESRFWEELRLNPGAGPPDRKNGPQIFGGISWTNHDITQMWYPSEGFFGKGPAILTGAYNYDAVADAFGNLSLKERLELAQQGGQLLHPEFKREVPLDRGLSIAWQRVPFIGGGWANWNRNDPQHRDAYNQLLSPDKRFYVGGDQVSYLPGWQEGAVLSAYHVVKQIIEGRPTLAALEKGEELPAPDTASSVGSR